MRWTAIAAGRSLCTWRGAFREADPRKTASLPGNLTSKQKALDLENSETTKIQRSFELQGVNLVKSGAFESGGNEFTPMRGKAGAVTNRAGGSPFWSAQGFAHERAGVGFAVLRGLSLVNKEELRNAFTNKSRKEKNHNNKQLLPPAKTVRFSEHEGVTSKTRGS